MSETQGKLPGPNISLAKQIIKEKTMKTRLVIFAMLVILLASCTPIATTSVTPTTVDVNAIRTRAVGTAMSGLTRQSTASPATPVSSPNPCMALAKAEKFNADRSDQGYFLGVLAISGYYTLLNAGLPGDAYKLLSADAQKASPRNQYVAAQKKNIKAIQIVTIEPYVAWQQQQGIIPAIFDRTNKIAFYVEIMLCCKVQKGEELQEMDVVDETFDKDLAEVKARGSRADRIAKLAFDDGINGLALPTLSIKAIQARLSHQFSPGNSFLGAQCAALSHRRNNVAFFDLSAIKASIGQNEPISNCISHSLTA